jgi:O-antigen/teichoic acid export membrane protein
MVFDREIIRFVSSREFLGTRETLASRWANQILPFLGIVLILSFIKQVFNYLFVAVDKQNILFTINLIGVIIGVIVGLIVIPKRNLLWGVITQILIETLFTVGAIIVAKKNHITPKIQQQSLWQLIGVFTIAGVVGFFINRYLAYQELHIVRFFLIALLFNGAIVLAILKPIKKIAKGLTID